MKIPYLFSLPAFAIVTVLLGGCEKFLEEKPQTTLAVIDEVFKAQAILDDHRLINDNMPSLGTSSADEFYMRQADYNSSTSYDRQIYLWSRTGIHRPTNNEWTTLYSNIYKSNVVLWNLDQMQRRAGDDSAWNATKGHALFIRALNFFEGAQIWCNAYDKTISANEMGMPLRLDPDFEKVSVRSTLEDTYAQILKDLKASASLLPVRPAHVVRPSRPAAYAVLARTYLAMRVYDSAAHYANLCLQFHNRLYNYNDIATPGASFPFSPKYSHPEIILDIAITGPPHTLHPNRSKIDSNLYRQFHPDDLRQKLYFTVEPDGAVRFKGSLVGSIVLFSGVTVAEMMLVKAECLARKNTIESSGEALQLLNTLLLNRYRTGTFNPIVYESNQQVLDTVLMERRKELLLRGQRWSDIKRLNKEGHNIVQTKFINNTLITLEPNSPRYATPIPVEVINFSGMPQNP